MSISVQESLVPSAVGMAFVEKTKCSDVVICAFVGDSTMGQGVVYESLNIASKWELPFLLVVESNGYAQTTPTEVQLTGRLSDRAAPS
jgi:TPP-dependent pyruvate/acetoin dehydrogenase alpha subunit